MKARKRLVGVLGVLLTAPVAAYAGNNCSKANAVINPGSQEVVDASYVNGERVPTTISIDGSNSGPRDTRSCEWTLVSGPQVTIKDPRSCAATFSAPDVPAGGQTLTLRLKVTSTETGCTWNNLKDKTDIKDTDVLVTNANLPPVVTVAAPAPAYEGMTVTLDGTASRDPDGDVLTFQWAQLSGTPVTISTPAPGLATFTAPPEKYPNGESLTFRLTVSDGSVSISKDLQVTVQSVNQLPVALITCPEEVNEGDPVELKDNGSSDPDEAPLTYAWSQLVGVPNADLSKANIAGTILGFTAPTLTSPQYDTMTFGLTVTDNGGLTSSADCAVKVIDVTPPVISGASDVTKEATSASGAIVSYAPVAHDAFYGDVPVTCTPSSESTFALGDTEVKCSASDLAAKPNTAEASFKVTVVDTTPPALTLPETFAPIEGNALGGAKVDYTATASDVVDGAVNVTCNAASGSLFPVGVSTVTCSATDAHNNVATGSFNVTVQDKTAPTVTVPSDIKEEATGASGATVNFTASALDIVDGSTPVTCSPGSGTVFALGDTTVTCTATDKAENKGSSSFKISVKDTTPPVVTAPADVTVYATGARTAVSFGSATATDAVGVDAITNDAPADGFPVGTHYITWTAKDKAGNAGTALSKVVVKPWTLTGFFAPIDMNGITNAVKAGATVPMKFRVFSGSSELTSTNVISSIQKLPVSCNTLSPLEDAVPSDAPATGGTVLRYDTTAGQFIYNWQTSKSSPGACYVVTATTLEGSTVKANFKLK